ncbi:DUF6153 family protein [Streptomyces sp. NPDC052236]|uniref:DUF6153 family protein n=1 Tax=Streptomyces sp. NPDC052236 TaxID=3365686 RepID=UPI0037D4730B
MTRVEQALRPQPALRLCALLVFGLFIGLIGMHGLGAMPTGAQMSVSAMSADGSHAAVEVTEPDACTHDAGGCEGHTEHADATCSASAVPGPPAPPALLPGLQCSADASDVRRLGAPGEPGGGRAPPSLAELQLLRI